MDSTIIQSDISQKILTRRGEQVILDRDLALLYGVTTKRLNEQVKRNIERFPEDFMFQLSEKEFSDWRSQNATSNSDKMGLRRAPYAFTEQGVYMLAEYYVGVHPCVYPSDMYQSKILNTLSKGKTHWSEGQTHGSKGQTHGSAPTGGL